MTQSTQTATAAVLAHTSNVDTILQRARDRWAQWRRLHPRGDRESMPHKEEIALEDLDYEEFDRIVEDLLPPCDLLAALVAGRFSLAMDGRIGSEVRGDPRVLEALRLALEDTFIRLIGSMTVDGEIECPLPWEVAS